MAEKPKTMHMARPARARGPQQPPPECGRRVPPEQMTDNPEEVTCASIACGDRARNRIHSLDQAKLAARKVEHGCGIATPTGRDEIMLDVVRVTAADAAAFRQAVTRAEGTLVGRLHVREAKSEHEERGWPWTDGCTHGYARWRIARYGRHPGTAECSVCGHIMEQETIASAT